MTMARIVMVMRDGSEKEIDPSTLPAAPKFINPVHISKQEAVERCGITEKQFDALVKDGIFPARLPGSRMWDRKDLNRHLEIARVPTAMVNPGWVYFMQMGDFIKIGWSTWPDSRRNALQNSNPYDIIILGAFPGPQESEHLVHQMFAKHRHRGEWFRRTPSLIAYIAWIKVAWRGHADLLLGDLDNVVKLGGKTVESHT